MASVLTSASCFVLARNGHIRTNSTQNRLAGWSSVSSKALGHVTHSIILKKSAFLVAAEGTDGGVGAEENVEEADEPDSANPISTLRSEAEILKRRMKRMELRKRRLKRKRRLRKLGRWPPSKVKKNKNI